MSGALPVVKRGPGRPPGKKKQAAALALAAAAAQRGRRRLIGKVRQKRGNRE